jgi:hypothetical protein
MSWQYLADQQTQALLRMEEEAKATRRASEALATSSKRLESAARVLIAVTVLLLPATCWQVWLAFHPVH